VQNSLAFEFCKLLVARGAVIVIPVVTPANIFLEVQSEAAEAASVIDAPLIAAFMMGLWRVDGLQAGIAGGGQDPCLFRRMYAVNGY
jgi:hypothetical protein